MRTTLESLWKKLQDDDRDPAGGWKRLRVPDLAGAPAYLAVSLTTGLEALILEIPTSAMPAGGSLPASVGFELMTEQVKPGRKGTTRIILALTSDGFRDVFRALAVDVAEVLVEAKTKEAAAATFISRVRRWQRFLEVHGPAGLSDSERRGLFSELLVLKELIVACSDPLRILEGWRGPVREPHDFVLLGGDIEVKSTASPSPRTIEIANFDQLDDLGAVRLLLIHTVLAEMDSGGQTLPGIIEDLLKVCGDAADVFKERLYLAGYIDEHASRYTVPCYRVLTSDFFEVTGDFPRLTRSGVTDGIYSAKYTILLSALEPFRVGMFHPESFTNP
jgi:hypothetical protein